MSKFFLRMKKSDETALCYAVLKAEKAAENAMYGRKIHIEGMSDLVPDAVSWKVVIYFAYMHEYFFRR